MPHPVEAAIAAMPPGRWVLAVSGGRDSMALLHAAWLILRRRDIAAVATFDHGTGPAATRAARHVEREAARFELTCVRGKGNAGRVAAPSEDALRRARWDFLHRTARKLGAQVVTAHTLDDHAETTFIRILRDSHARGLAGMLAPSNVQRPLLFVRRADVAAWARENDVTWVEDPTNASLAYLRNRVRLELLPALERARPGFTQWLLITSARGAAWRRGLSGAVDHLAAGLGPGILPVTALDGMRAEAAAVVWPEVASRVGITLDRRGIERLVAEAPKLKPGKEIPLSGGASLARTVTTFVFRNPRGGGPLY
jgi:tRNA(Ile)-lysidine synthase